MEHQTPPPPSSSKESIGAFCTRNNLPDLTRWATFEDDVTPRSVRAVLHERLTYMGEYVERLLYPEGLTDGWESAVLSESEHTGLETLHRTIVLLEKDCALLDLESTPEDDMALIKRLVKEWPSLVADISSVLVKTRAAYTDVRRSGHNPSYLG